jgi:uncharacterized protein
VTAYLLDVNVLIALVDPAHLHHDRAHSWFAKSGKKNFATCAITENGLLRIIGHPKYPNSPGPPSQVMPQLAAIRALPGHQFWPNDISLADENLIKAERLSSHVHITDTYLLALALINKGKLATLDHKLSPASVVNGLKSLELI